MYKSTSLSAEPKTQEGEALPRGRVNEVCQEWMVREDGALAYRLQAQEFDEHLSGNKFRNAVVREDFPKAKTEQMREQQLAEQTAMIYQRMLAEQEEHDKVVAKQLAEDLEREERMKRRALEVHDQDIARQLLERERSRVEQRHHAHAAALSTGYHHHYSASSSSSTPPPPPQLPPQRPPPPSTYENFPPPAPPPPPQRPESYGYPQQQRSNSNNSNNDVRMNMMMMTSEQQLLLSHQSQHDGSLSSSSGGASGPMRRQARAMPLPFQMQKHREGQPQIEELEDLDEHGDLYTEPYRNPDQSLLAGDFSRIDLKTESQIRKNSVPSSNLPSEVIATTPPSPPPPLLMSPSLGNADDELENLPIELVNEQRLLNDRQLQEEKDAELARQLQAQEGSLEDTLIHRDRMLAIEAQDKELAKMLQERERTKARKAREKAKAKALARKQQQQQLNQQQPQDLQPQPMTGGVGAGMALYSRESAHQQQQQQHRLSSEHIPPQHGIIMPDDSYSFPADLIPGAASLMPSRRIIPGTSEVYSLPQEENEEGEGEDGNYSTPIDMLPPSSGHFGGEFYRHRGNGSHNNNNSGSSRGVGMATGNGGSQPRTSPSGSFGEFYNYNHHGNGNNSGCSRGGGVATGNSGNQPPQSGSSSRLFDYNSGGPLLSSPGRVQKGENSERFSNGSSGSPSTSSDNNFSNLIRPSTLMLESDMVGNSSGVNAGGNFSRLAGDGVVPAVRPNQLDLRSPLTRPTKTRYHHPDQHPLMESSDLTANAVTTTTSSNSTATDITCTTPTPTSTSGGGGGSCGIASSQSSPSHVNIAMAIDPTYPRNRGGGMMHQSASSSFDTASSGTVTTSTSSSSPGLILPPPDLSEVEDDSESGGGGAAPPYMPIQGQRRNLSLEKKQKKSKNKEGGGCKQQ